MRSSPNPSAPFDHDELSGIAIAGPHYHYDMPHMTSGALLHRVRQTLPDLPIYVVTALAKRLSDPRLTDGQVSGILPKPINMAHRALAEHVEAG